MLYTGKARFRLLGLALPDGFGLASSRKIVLNGFYLVVASFLHSQAWPVARVVPFDSIAVSGHKFFGFDEPMGIFITTKKTLKATNPFKVAYLNEAVPTLTCSRNALSALKFWWKIQKTGLKGFEKQAQAILANAQYLEEQLNKIGYKAWQDDYSNTVYFRRPGENIMKKYTLAPEYDEQLGGKMAHIVVMQHTTREIIDEFIKDLKAEGIPKSSSLKEKDDKSSPPTHWH